MLGLGDGDVKVTNAQRTAPRGGSSTGTSSLPLQGGRSSLLPPASSAAKVEGQVNIKIDGLPPGSRVENVSGGTMPLNIDAGYSANALGMP